MSVDKNITILLVEDSKFTRRMETQIINGLGFADLVEADDGDTAIRILETNRKIDLIISDWNMPRLSGYELLKWVRADARRSATPFIMATAQGEKRQEKEAAEAGVSGLVPKPFTAEDLMAKIEQAFSEEKVEVASAPKSRALRRDKGGRVILTMAHIQITDHLVLGVLKQLIEKEQLLPKHFALETVCMPGWNPVRRALEEAEIDGALVLAPIAMDVFAHGTPIKLVLLAHKNGSIFVRSNRDGQEAAYKFFRGKIFYIPHQLSVHNIISHMYMSDLGLRPGITSEAGVDVQFEVVPPVKMPEFLAENPKAAGFMVAEPLGTKSIAMEIAQLEFLSAEVWKDHPCCVVTLRQEVIGEAPEAAQEFVDMLVEAGKFIESRPGNAARIGVGFLDPNGKLGLNESVLKNVLTEPMGISTNNLYPVVEDLEYMRRYMAERMGIGTEIDLRAFVDTRFADIACKGLSRASYAAAAFRAGAVAARVREARSTAASSKVMLDKEGQYLIFNIAGDEYGIAIRSMREIIGMQPLNAVPGMPGFAQGVINLRGKIIPVFDLRKWFGMEAVQYTNRTSIIVAELAGHRSLEKVGIIVDAVSEVVDIPAEDIEAAPVFGGDADTDYILAMAKVGTSIKILLDVNRMVG